MKGVPIPTDELEELRAGLAKAGLIKDGAALDLLPYQPAFARRSEHRHAHYLVSSKQKAICHLVVGKNLASLHARARDFAAACPKLACRPLLYHKGSGSNDYLCLEHFPGESLDVAVQSGRYTAADWLKAVRHAQHLLAATEQPSDPVRLQEEVTALVNHACAFPGFTDVDARLLHDLAQPALLDTTLNGPLVTRWSTGDFVGRNLLVDVGGDVRLIDYDHAVRTHFGRSDWLRLIQFSVLPSGLDISSVNELQFAHRPAHEVYLWLHQLSLLREAEPTEETKRHIASTVQNLFAAVAHATDRKSGARAHSFLISSLVDQQAETDSVLEKRTAWAKTLDADLQKARAALIAQTSLLEERTVWARSLEQNLHSTRQNLEKLTAEYAERTTWAKSLEADLEQARTAHQDQFQQATRLGGELAAVDKACIALAALLPGSSGWDRAALVERSLRSLVDLQREVAAKNAAINTSVAATQRAQLDSEIAESDAHRLAAALADAQLHVDGLLQHAAQLQNSINLLQATKQETEAALRENERLLKSSIADLQTTRAELSRYEGRLICRLAAGPSSLSTAAKSQP